MEDRTLTYIQRSHRYTYSDIKVNSLLLGITGGITLMLISVMAYYVAVNDIWPQYFDDWFLYLIAIYCFISGFYSFFISLKELIENKEFLLINEDRLPYWRQDYHWPKEVLKSGNKSQLNQYFWIIPLFLICPLFIVYSNGLNNWVGKGVVILFAFVFFLLVKKIIADIQHHLSYGDSKLIPTTMPIYIGEGLEATLINNTVCRDFEKLHVSLKLIQEEEVVVKEEDANVIKVKFMRLYEYQASFETKANQCNIQIPIADDLPSTHLYMDATLYWVLDIKAHNQHLGKQYECTFLLPIYERL